MSDDPASWGAKLADDDPASWGAKPATEDGFAWSKAVTDIPSEIASEAKAGAADVMALGRRGEMGAVEGLMSLPKAVIGAARVPLSPITGAARSLIGHTMANLEHKAGEYIAPEIAAKDIPEKMYETAKGDVDLAMSAMAARRPIPAPAGTAIPPPPKTIGDFDVPLTEGEAAGDVGKIALERRALRSDAEGQKANEVAKNFMAEREQALEAARNRIGESFDPYGQTIAETPHQAAEIAGEGLQTTAKNLKDLSRARYEEMRNLPGEFHAGAFEGIAQRIKGDLTLGTNPVIIDDVTTPIAARALKDVEEQIGSLRIQNKADPFGAPNPENIVAVNLEGVDQARKRLVSFYKDAKTYPPTPDTRATQAVLRSFDDQIENAITKGLFSGDERALEALKEARGLHSYYKKMFSSQGSGDDVGQAMQRILGTNVREQATPTEIANYLYGTASVGAKGLSYRLAERLKVVLGERSPEWAGVKQGLWKRLTEAPEGKTDWGPEKVANRIAEFLNGDGSATAKRMLGEPEREMMQRYADVLRKTVPPPGAVNYSNNVPMIASARDGIIKFMTAEIGAMLGGVPGAIAGWAVGTIGKPISETMKARKIANSMPSIAESMRRWDNAIDLAMSGKSPSLTALTAASTNLISRLRSIGAPSELLERIRGVVGSVPTAAQNNQKQGNGQRDNEPDQGAGGKFHGGPVNRARGGEVKRALQSLQSYAEGGATGMVEKGNIDLHSRPVVHNPDGSISTVRSISRERDGREVLMPTVYGQSILSDDDAERLYLLSGKHLGKFDTPQNADAYARQLHDDQAREYVGRAKGGAVNHNHNPTEAQKKAGNYAKTHKYFQGLDITIENLKGKSRSGVGKNGKRWSVRMPADYGYIKRTEGADGDHVDVYLGPNDKSDQVFVVDQKDAETGRFDEHKVMMGFDNEAEARKTYRAGFSDGKDRIKNMRRMSMTEFRQWLEKGDTSKPIGSRSAALKIAYQSKRDIA